MAKKIGIVGAGPAGMMSALSAKAYSADVTLFDTNLEVGRKLAIAGGTRCNITHIGSAKELAAHYHEAERFMLSSLSRFDNTSLRNFFHSRLELPTIVESDGRVFPEIQSGNSVATRFRIALENAGVNLRLGHSVLDLSPNASGLDLDGEIFAAVILCCGGASYPSTGSTGWGYSTAGRLGHDLTPLLPGLSGIPVCEGWLTQLSGIRLANAGIYLKSQSKKRRTFVLGELLFTHFGLSGPTALNLSRWVAKEYQEYGSATLLLDLVPHLNQEELRDSLATAATKTHQLQVKTVIKDLLPEALASAACGAAGFDPTKPCGRLKKKELADLAAFLKAVPLTANSLRPLTAAKVTSGGICLRQVDPKTMASKLIPGLYFAGEILDVDGQSGGYNLQAAFSTGFSAGTFAALS